MKSYKVNRKLFLDKKVIAQLDYNQLGLIEGGGKGNTGTTCVCSLKTCGCTHKGCNTQLG